MSQANPVSVVAFLNAVADEIAPDQAIDVRRVMDYVLEEVTLALGTGEGEVFMEALGRLEGQRISEGIPDLLHCAAAIMLAGVICNAAVRSDSGDARLVMQRLSAEFQVAGDIHA